MDNVPKRQAQGPDQWLQAARSLGARQPATLSHPLTLPHQSPAPVLSCSLVSHHVSLTPSPTCKVIHSDSHGSALSITHGDIYRATYTVTPPISPITMAVPFLHAITHPYSPSVSSSPTVALTDVTLTALSCPPGWCLNPPTLAPQPANASPLPLSGPGVSRGCVQGTTKLEISCHLSRDLR